MKYTLTAIFAFCLLFSFSLEAQTLEYLEASGKIPKEFITPSVDKYESKIADLEKTSEGSNSKKERKNKKAFYLESSFSIDDILQSGYVLFNDKATKYANEVLQKLPMSAKLKKSNPRVYLLNSNVVNAFATEQGIIFISVGLLANLETEAQLAFILGHELSHIEEKHGLDKFLRNKEISSRDYQKNLKKMGVDNSLFSESMYSKKIEMEADKEGLELFLKSDYGFESLEDAFEVLHYAYLPFEDKAFPKSFFEDENYILPEVIWEVKMENISSMEEDEYEEDENDTHPSAISRMVAVRDVLEEEENLNKSEFLVSENTFFEIRDLMRFQLPLLALESGQYARALYNAFLLLDKYPDNIELKKIIGKALYYQSKFHEESVYDIKKLKEDKVYENEQFSDGEGEAQRIGVLFTLLTEKEMTVLALKYNYELREKMGRDKDRELDWIISDLFIDLSKGDKALTEFKSSPFVEEKVEEENSDTTDVKLSSRKAQIKEANRKAQAEKANRKTQIKKANEEALKKQDFYWKYAFVDYVKSEEFINEFKEGEEAKEERIEREIYYKSEEGREEYEKEKDEDLKFGRSFGIKKVVVVNPFYMSLDERKDNPVQLIRTEKGQKNFRNLIIEASEKSDLKVDLLDMNAIGRNDVEKFNEISALTQYFYQQFEFSDLALTPSTQQNEIDAITEKYNTDYFLYTGVISLREKEGAMSKLCLGLLIYPFLPFVLYDISQPDYDMLHYAMLFDVKTGRRSILSMNYFDAKDTNFLVKAHTYDVFYQINKKGKRK